MDIKPEYKKKSIRSFVIRGGRITEGQEAAFKQWWPSYGLSLFSGTLAENGGLRESAPLIVEVGFGMGDSLWQMVKQAPEADFVGIEVHPPGVGRLINNAGKDELTNLKVYMADATDVMTDCIADNSIDRFQLYFPDPWHKKKHHKRRIVQPEFVNLIVQKLKPGGIIHMATDWENYAEHMIEVLKEISGIACLGGEDGYAEKPSYRPHTKFEARGERLGHGVWDILYQKIASSAE